MKRHHPAAGYTARLLELAATAAPGQEQAARAWYPSAHGLAAVVGNGDVRAGAGILAALSPQKSWAANVRLALDARDGHIHGHTAANLAKVRRILAGADPAGVLPMNLKTGNFYLNLLEPGNPEPVTVDRWAYRAAAGIWDRGHARFSADFGIGRPARYAVLAAAFRAAAREAGLPPPAFQALAWIVLRDRIGVRFAGETY